MTIRPAIEPVRYAVAASTLVTTFVFSTRFWACLGAHSLIGWTFGIWPDPATIARAARALRDHDRTCAGPRAHQRHRAIRTPNTREAHHERPQPAATG